MVTRKKTAKRTPKAGGDVITVDNRGDQSAIAAGRGAKAVVSQKSSIPEMETWRKDMEKQIEAAKGLLPADKADLKENVAKIAEEVSKGKKADPGRLERLFNTLSGMAPDIFEVALVTLANPLAGLGLVAKKIGDRARVEAK
jgi:hypothetical protein